MKTMLAICLSFFSLSVFACPNFSGEYFNEEFGTYYSIAQDGCETISYIFDEGVVDSSVDGKEYLVNEYDIVVEEGQVLAHVSIFESNSWNGEKLITKQRSETTYASGDVDHDSGSSETYLNEDTDLVTVTHGADGSETIIDKRVN